MSNEYYTYIRPARFCFPLLMQHVTHEEKINNRMRKWRHHPLAPPTVKFNDGSWRQIIFNRPWAVCSSVFFVINLLKPSGNFTYDQV
jgi:hypothetical protein